MLPPQLCKICVLPPQTPATVCQRPGWRKRAAFARCRQEDRQDGDEDIEAGREDHQDGDEDDEAGQEDHQDEDEDDGAGQEDRQDGDEDDEAGQEDRQDGDGDDGEGEHDDGDLLLNVVSKVLSNKKCF